MQILLNKIGATKAKKTIYDYSSNEEEVLAFDDSSDDDDESDMEDKVYGTDVEEEDLDDDMEENEDEEADGTKWGRKKGAYYSGLMNKMSYL